MVAAGQQDIPAASASAALPPFLCRPDFGGGIPKLDPPLDFSPPQKRSPKSSHLLLACAARCMHTYMSIVSIAVMQ